MNKIIKKIIIKINTPARMFVKTVKKSIIKKTIIATKPILLEPFIIIFNLSRDIIIEFAFFTLFQIKLEKITFYTFLKQEKTHYDK